MGVGHRHGRTKLQRAKGSACLSAAGAQRASKVAAAATPPMASQRTCMHSARLAHLYPVRAHAASMPPVAAAGPSRATAARFMALGAVETGRERYSLSARFVKLAGATGIMSGKPSEGAIDAPQTREPVRLDTIHGLPKSPRHHPWKSVDAVYVAGGPGVGSRVLVAARELENEGERLLEIGN